MRHSDQRALTRSSIRLPLFGFGGASLYQHDKTFSVSRARDTIATAWDEGVRYFDTAPLYAYGMSERLIGDEMRSRSEDCVISTKVGRLLRPGGDVFPGQPRIPGVPFAIEHDYSRAGTLRSLEDSMQRLGVDRIDVAFIHDIDAVSHGDQQPDRFREALEGAYPALMEMKAAGIVGAVGLGVNEWQVCAEMLRHVELDYCIVAGRYTLIETQVLDSFLPLCRQRGVALVIGGPYNSGVLAAHSPGASTFDYRPVSPAIATKVDRMRAVCADFDVPLAAVALQFPAGEECVASIIPGARTPDEVRQNVAFFSLPIPAQLWDALKDERLLRPDAPVPGSDALPASERLVDTNITV